MRVPHDNAIVLGIVVTVTAGYLLVIHRTQSADLGEVRASTAECRRKLAADSAKADFVPSMAREIGVMKRRYNKDWDRRLPESQELAGFLREISANLSEEKLVNQIIQPGRPTRGPLYNRLPITMKFEGSFLALAGFLGRVDGMTRLTRIEELKIEPIRGSEDLAIELGMSIYFTEQ